MEGGSNPSIFEDYDDGFGADNGGGGDYNYDEDYFGETGGFRSTVRRGDAWGGTDSTGHRFRFPPEIPADRRRFPPANAIRDLY